MKRRRQNGFTVIELVISVFFFAVIMITAAYVLRAVMQNWVSQETRAGIDINLDRGVEEMVRDIRSAGQIQSTAGYDEIRIFQPPSTYSIFYLFNAADSYGPPPVFNQSTYQLKKANLGSAINGTFTYGSGQVIANDVLPPPTSDLSFSGSLVTIDLSARRGEETIRSRTQVRPRNV